jgi:hypothetical protein
MILLNFINNKSEEIIIKLDEQEDLLSIYKQLHIQQYEGFYTIIHRNSKSFATSKNKLEAYKTLITSKEFQHWYNKKIAKIFGCDHIKEEKWQAMTANIRFQIMKDQKWLDVNDDFFLKDFDNINVKNIQFQHN